MTTVWVPCDAAAVALGRRRRRRRARGGRGHGAPQRLAGDAVAGAARRGRDRRAAGSGTPERHRSRRAGRCSPATLDDDRPLHRRRRRARLARPAAPGLLRAGRRHRADRPRGLPRARRAASASQRALSLCPRGGRRRGHGVRPARPWRRGLPGRHQVGDGAHGIRRREVRLLQRRRGRQRHLRRPHAHRGRPVHARRGHGDRGASRWARPRATSTCAASTPTPSAPCAGPSTSRTRTACSASRCSAAADGSTSTCGWAPAPTSAARRPRCSSRSRASAGEVRAKPPIPALEGLFGRPTVVNNVLTLGAVPMVLADGGEAYAALGTGRSRGTQVFQLAGNVARGGIVEADFGISLGELVDGLRRRHGIRAAGEGGAGGRAARRVPAAGAVRPADGLRGVRGCRRDGRARRRRRVGRHDGRRRAMARFAMEFCAKESCGKCTPCRIGSTRGVEVIDRIRAADRRRRAAHPARAARGPLHDDDQGVAVRDGRADPDAGAQRARALPRGLRRPGAHARKGARP